MRGFAISSGPNRLLLAAMVGSLTACGAFIGDAAEQAAEAPVEAYIDPAQQRAFEEVATDPQMLEGVRALSRAATEGAMAAATESLLAERGALRESIVATVGEMRPEVRALVAESSRAAVSGMMQGMAEGIERDLAPALRQAWPRDLSGALVEPLRSQEFQHAVGELTRTISYNAVVGTNRGLGAAEQRDGGLNLLSWLGTPLTVGWAALVAFATSLGIAVVIMMILLLKGRSERRHLQTDTERREELMIAVMQTMATREMDQEEREHFFRELARLREESHGRAPSGDVQVGA